MIGLEECPAALNFTFDSSTKTALCLLKKVSDPSFIVSSANTQIQIRGLLIQAHGSTVHKECFVINTYSIHFEILNVLVELA